MRITYICETCGKTYTDEQAAQNCEAAHKEHEARRQAEIAQEKNLLSAINDATNLYVQRYGKMPVITLTEENEKTMLNEMCRLMYEEGIFGDSTIH